jgi:hypothetical protein
VYAKLQTDGRTDITYHHQKGKWMRCRLFYISRFKVIPETLRAHDIRYRRFHLSNKIIPVQQCLHFSAQCRGKCAHKATRYGRTEGHSLNDISPPKGEMDEVQIVLYVSVFIVNVHYYLSVTPILKELLSFIT